MSSGQQMPPGLQEQIAKMQQSQQNLQSILAQKQQVDMENTESERALEELQTASEHDQVFKYAGSVYKDIGKLEELMDSNGDTGDAFKTYAKHWGELKGFSLALQTGKNNLGETATRLNRLIGSGPLLTNLGQVVDIDSTGEYVRDQGSSWGEYMLHMLKLQLKRVRKVYFHG